MKKVKVRDLQPGMMVDLENDEYAGGGDFAVLHEHEYAVVDTTVIETNNCTVVYFEAGNPVGFPPDHELPMHGFMKEVDQ